MNNKGWREQRIASEKTNGRIFPEVVQARNCEEGWGGMDDPVIFLVVLTKSNTDYLQWSPFIY